MWLFFSPARLCVLDVFILSIFLFLAYTGANTSAGSYAGGADHPIDCETNTKTAEHQFCYFDVRKIKSECSASRMFGYSEGKPCILIKLNRVSTLASFFLFYFPLLKQIYSTEQFIKLNL